jgi:hypothetical protein
VTRGPADVHQTRLVAIKVRPTYHVTFAGLFAVKLIVLVVFPTRTPLLHAAPTHTRYANRRCASSRLLSNLVITRPRTNRAEATKYGRSCWSVRTVGFVVVGVVVVGEDGGETAATGTRSNV